MLERIWQRNQGVLRSLARSVSLDASQVEDILQDAFSKLLRSRRTFPSERETYNYMRRVVVNTSIDHYRSQKRRRRRLFPLSRGAEGVIDGTGLNPLARLLRQEEREARHSLLEEVEQALQELTAEQREAIDILFSERDRPIKDICRERKIPYSTLRCRALAGIDRVRDHLRERGLYTNHQEVRDADL